MKCDNKQNIIADPTVLDDLRKCKTVKELEACLNQMDIECNYEDALHFLRTWEKLDEEREVMELEELDHVSGGSGGIGGFFKSFLKRGTSSVSDCVNEPLTIADILNRMN